MTDDQPLNTEPPNPSNDQATDSALTDNNVLIPTVEQLPPTPTLEPLERGERIPEDVEWRSLEEAKSLLKCAALDAVNTIIDILQDDAIQARLRLDAAKTVLNMTIVKDSDKTGEQEYLEHMFKQLSGEQS